MNKFILLFSVGFLISSVSLFGQSVSRLEQEEHLLDGMSFTYQYQSGAAVDISFAEGKLTYQWIAGRNAGKPAKTYAYKSRKLGDGIFYVNWREPDFKNFITLVYNFHTNTCASSVIVNYGGENPITAFEGGIIEKVKKE